MKKIDILLGFDMETDVGSWTPFYRGLVGGTPPILKILKKHKATGTFYFVGKAALDVPQVIRSVKKAGHEIGAHSLFHETVGDAIFPIPGITPLLVHEVEKRLELNTKWIQEVVGVRPRSFRCPRLFGSTAVCNALEKLGYVSDSSYPMYFYKEQLTPYHPSARDWTRKGNLRLVQIPNFADMSMVSKDKYGRDRDQWPIFRTKSAKDLLKRIDHFLAYLENKKVSHAVLSFYFHPWEFFSMPQGLIHFGEGAVLPDPFIVKNCGAYAVKELDRLVQGLKDRGACFKTAAQIAKDW